MQASKRSAAMSLIAASAATFALCVADEGASPGAQSPASGASEQVGASQGILDNIAFQMEAIAQLTTQYRATEKRAAQLAEQVRAGRNEHARQDLAIAVRRSFQLRQQIQQKKLSAAHLQLTVAKERLTRREELADAIIRRRIEELVSAADLSWRSTETGGSESGGKQRSTNLQHQLEGPRTIRPRYDDMSLTEWLTILSTERKPERLTEAVRALTALSDDKSAYSVTESVFRLMRKFGSNTIDQSPRGELIAASQLAIWKAPPEVAVDAMMRELQEGNSRSRQFLVWMLHVPEFGASSGVNHRELERIFHKAIGDRAGEIISLLLRSSDQVVARQWEVEFLTTFASVIELSPEEMNMATSRLQTALPSEDAKLTVLIASVLASDHPTTPGLVESLTDVLKTVDGGSPSFHHAREAMQHLSTMGPHASAAVPRLLQLLTEIMQGDPQLRSPHGATSEMAGEIADTLGQIGSGAGEAIPTLQCIAATSEGMLERRARRAIHRIRGIDPVDSAAKQIRSLERLMHRYRLDVGEYPPTEQGLLALKSVPPGLLAPDKWQGPYITSEIPQDPWERQYRYQRTAPNEIRIWSLGPDMMDRTGDEVSGDQSSDG